MTALRWIPVSERLPASMAMVLAWYAPGQTPRPASYDCGSWWDLTDDFGTGVGLVSADVTHWLPLDALPKPGEEGVPEALALLREIREHGKAMGSAIECNPYVEWTAEEWEERVVALLARSGVAWTDKR